MPPHARHSGTGNGNDSLAAGHGRQKLKLAAIGYVNARHGVDADAEIALAGLALLAQTALEYYEALMGAAPKNRPADPFFQLDDVDVPEAIRARQRLKLAAFAYVNARHGIDADQGMSRTGLALLAQAALEYYEALVVAAPKRQPSAEPRHQLGNGAGA
jgi:hypothetical protein